MPLTPPQVALMVAPNLLATGHVGMGMSKLAQAVGLGVSNWAVQTQVSVTGAGSAGTGVATLPLVILQPILLAAIETSFLSVGIKGVFSPLTALGLANGFALALPQGIILVQVVGVGSGAGTAKLISPPAYPAFQQAFATFGLTGPGAAMMSAALGMSFDKLVASFLMPIPIVGPSGPAPGVGSGTGKIV